MDIDKKKLNLIKNEIRKLSLRSKERQTILNSNRKQIQVGTFKDGRPKMVYHYQCNKCKEWFRSKDVEVDHIEEVGKGHTDLNVLAARILCGVDNLQVLCVKCHSHKTRNFMSNVKRKK